jgi:PTS system mannose-specific IIC component
MTFPAAMAVTTVVGGLLVVERNAFLQAGLARPLVACTLLGTCLGQTLAGVVVGAPLELFFLGAAHLGAALSDHETLASCAVSSAAAVACEELGRFSLVGCTLALLALLPFGLIGRATDGLDNRVRQHFADKAVVLMDEGRYRDALRMNWRALWFPWMVGALGVACGATVGLLIAWVVPQLSHRIARGITSSFLFASAACAAIASQASRHPRATWLATGSAVVTLGALLLLDFLNGHGPP